MTCPICRKAIEVASADSSTFQPFCSERCRRIDFHRWCDGKYSIVEQLDPDAINLDTLNMDLDQE